MHPHYQKVIAAYLAANRPYFHQVTPVEARAMFRASLAAAPPQADLPALAEVADEIVAGPHGDIPVRRYVPHGHGAGTGVYLHSGGWVIGDIDFSDATCRRLAALAGCEIISVDYRLAPEHPFPQPLDDAYAVIEWAAAFRPGPLIVIGESAGGNLATACTIRARDSGGPKLAGQVLAYPVTDHGFDTESYCEVGDKNWLLSAADMRWFWDQYCPAGIDRSQPLVAPLRVEKAAGLPPTFIAIAELDPLRSEGLAYARRLADAGVLVTSRVDAGMLHGYLGAAGVLEPAAAALAAAGAWMRQQLQ